MFDFISFLLDGRYSGGMGDGVRSLSGNIPKIK
jgi:hypothetical protein